MSTSAPVDPGTGDSRRDLSDLLASWPDPSAASLAVTSARHTLARGGDTTRVSGVASISKVVVALAALVAVEEGTLDLDEAAGPPGSTVRHLLAHASGLAFDEHRQLADVGSRRIYSNAGIEQLAEHLAVRANMAFERYQHEAVIAPLGMTRTRLDGSPAHGVHSCVDDLIVLGRELLRPTLIAQATLRSATTVQFPDLRGVLPGFGTFDPNPWGLGVEIRGTKQPHWTAPDNSPHTFGHFGGTGTYLWVDPRAGLACAAISGTEYGPWANEVWPVTNQSVLHRYAA